MGSNAVNKFGFYFDELKKLRIWDPEVANKTRELTEACNNFVQKMNDFDQMALRLISSVEELSHQVEREKMRALGTSNLLLSMANERETQRQQYQALIVEKATELDRLRVQHQALLKTEAEQQELLDQLQLF